MAPEIERNHWSIVLVGSLNPAIFHPAWFAMHGVISKEHAETAEVKVVHPDITSVEFGNLRIEVQQKRFLIQTELAPEVAILDFVLRVFGDLLPHTHINQIGINKSSHFRTPNADSRVHLGRLFAPTKPWGAFGQRIDDSTRPLVGGMMNVTMRELLDEREWSGHLEARLAPSPELDVETGVHVSVNNHFDLKDHKESDGALRALQLIREGFDLSMTKADEIISAVRENAK